MKNSKNWISYLLLGLALTLFAGPVLAVSTVTPAIASYTVGSNATINVTWTIDRVAVNPSGGDTGDYNSGVGVFTDAAGQITLGTVNTTISSNDPTGALNFVPVSESFQIPQGVLQNAAAGSFTSIRYTRTFTNPTTGLSTAPISLRVQLVTPTTPATPVSPSISATDPRILTVDRIALRFNDNSIVKVVKPDTRIMAVAEIRYTGTGLLDAVWEVATPASTLGSQSTDRLIYTPLRSVRQYLGAGGRIYLQSPPLPADMQGNYVARLRVVQPRNLGFTQPILRYAVNEGGEAISARKQPPIKIAAPANRSLLRGDTRFVWQPVRGARAYQLELYLPKDGKQLSSELSERGYDESSIAEQAPATGILVPGKKTSLSLGAVSRQHLRHGETYLWRIVAVGRDGQILSTSPIREIRVP